MNVLFVSQCTKRALTETRRILDQFAERRGDRTWQTPITQAGLDTVRKLLRQSARKNTAVACHWIRGRDHSELMWVVGDARQFNAEGAVPTASTGRDILRAADESHWHRLPLMSAMTALAALLHDLGKATRAFQEKLSGSDQPHGNHYRHEWVSVRLFQAFVGSAADDADWLTRLAACSAPSTDPHAFESQWLDHAGGRLLRDGLDQAAARNLPFATMPPLAQAVAWLILTHHRLPCMPVAARGSGQTYDDDEQHAQSRWHRFGAQASDSSGFDPANLFRNIDANWNEPRDAVDADELAACWAFPHGLPVSTDAWRKQAARYANKLLNLPCVDPGGNVLDDAFAMHVARLCLMLADHHYSSITDESRRSPYRNAGYPLYANTLRNGERGAASASSTRTVFNQTLDEHLLGVQAHASLVTHSLPTLVRSLPTLRRHRALSRRNRNPHFQWQDKAADLAVSIRLRSAEHGAFVVNLASTGCGKTLGNARIMNALADPQRGMRCAFAIGLRALTLQTGRSFQRDLGLRDDQLALRVGGSAARAVFEHRERLAEASGSASSQRLIDEDGQILYEGDDSHALLQRLTSDASVRALIAAPVLVCTVDHLMPATESLRGGHQIAPMLRLMTGDLVLDEPDDFDMLDLPALTRLVHWTGLLGARVLLSSATLPPALVEGLFLAYLDGRRHYQRNRGERADEAPSIPCLWVDEFSQSHRDCGDAGSFKTTHGAFVETRTARLAKAEVRRRARLIDVPDAWVNLARDARREAFAGLALAEAWQLHRDPQNHRVDPSSGKRVSLGLIRMSNIDPLFDVALAMYRHGAPVAGLRIHLCVYHSQFPLLSRSHIEAQLDAAFDRHARDGETDALLSSPDVRAMVERYPEADQMFVVLASPVCEVGRDWDADWAIAEPSSMRSLIQLGGRVRRHRDGAVDRPNMAVFDANLRCFEARGKGEPVFTHPGFEMRGMVGDSNPGDTQRLFHLRHRRLRHLLALPPDAQDWVVDSRPRIRKAEDLQPASRLADLEHGRMWDTMLPRDAAGRWHTPIKRDATQHWRCRDADGRHRWLTGVMPQCQPFRFDPVKRDEVVLMPDDSECELHLHVRYPHFGRAASTSVDERNRLLPAVAGGVLSGRGIDTWCEVDLLEQLQRWAEAHGQTLAECAWRYSTVRLPKSDAGWRYHSALGFCVD
ncbi:type I-F CRISPR-associated helicase Cas3f [Burkholderia sp. 3C]